MCRQLSDKEFKWQLKDYCSLLAIRKSLGPIKFLGAVDMTHIYKAIDSIDIMLFGRLKVLSTGYIAWPNY